MPGTGLEGAGGEGGWWRLWGWVRRDTVAKVVAESRLSAQTLSVISNVPSDALTRNNAKRGKQ